MSFTLKTTFSDQALAVLFATGTNVVVAKPPSGASPNVAWIVFRPLESNFLSWEENYGIYASTQTVQNGATLTQMAATPFPAIEGRTYTLLPQGFFSPSTSAGTSGSYSATNQFSSPQGFMTIGLFQSAVVNGTPVSGNAVSAAEVLPGSTATMTPFTTVYIWTQSQVSSNTVVTNITSAQTEATFGAGVTEIDLTYDLNSGMFLPSSDLAEAAVSHRIPVLV